MGKRATDRSARDFELKRLFLMQPPFSGRTQHANQEEDVLGIDATIEEDREEEDAADDG